MDKNNFGNDLDKWDYLAYQRNTVTSDDVLEKYYQEGLEERLIAYLAKKYNISLEEAMDIYYHSNMAENIHEGKYGVQYLDYKVLAQILADSEPELFAHKNSNDNDK